jgi:nucleoid-associated protein YgaU
VIPDLEGVMGLRDKYAYAISVAKGKFDGSAQEKDGKLHFVGSVKTEAEKNEIWTAIKTIPDWKNEVVAEIKVTGGGAPAATATAGKNYTVKAGDTLSKIAKEHLGDANAYMKIFEANRDKLSNPDLIKPGQVLTIP